MKKSLFFGVLIWLAALTISFIGGFLIGGNQFIAFSFEKDFQLFNYLQAALVSFIGLLIILGITKFASKKSGVVNIFYILLSLALAAINIVLLVMLIQKNPISVDTKLNTIMLAIASGLSVISIFPICKISSSSKVKVAKAKNTRTEEISEPFKPMVLRENPSEIPEFNPDFTSTPNEETFNISDKLAQLKEDINNNNFPETEELNEDTASYDKTQEELTRTHVIDWDDETQTQTSENLNFEDFEPLKSDENTQYNEFENTPNNEPLKPVMENVAPINNIPKLEELPPILEPKDPYKQTIVPRRAAQRAGEFDQPIGNVVKPTYVERTERKMPRVDENYQGKVFLGDSDRIWEAMKKQERNLTPKAPKTDHLVSKSNIVNSLQSEKTKTMEIDIDSIMDPVNDQNDEDFTPTIDWDD
ncbi:hypothetical protein [Spiroplasma sp. BIUS-1]|uniref:hypothetical protein n=1 Tax=Spiroplasma sp. BIUS-1 TaxID=216964 RepID=UPI00139912A3|nr:hypothetical protein [Spiroplasma sp. BIUS-1]QHX36873.1 APC family permease [Spiroplasma sp. BIUS-1]